MDTQCRLARRSWEHCLNASFLVVTCCLIGRCAWLVVAGERGLHRRKDGIERGKAVPRARSGVFQTETPLIKLLVVLTALLPTAQQKRVVVRRSIMVRHIVSLAVSLNGRAILDPTIQVHREKIVIEEISDGRVAPGIIGRATNHT